MFRLVRLAQPARLPIVRFHFTLLPTFVKFILINHSRNSGYLGRDSPQDRDYKSPTSPRFPDRPE